VRASGDETDIQQLTKLLCLPASAAGFDYASNTTHQRRTYMALNLKPLGDRVLVEPLEEKEVKKGGIIIPDSAKEKPTEGVVRALGTGKTDDNGKKVPFEVPKSNSTSRNTNSSAPTTFLVLSNNHGPQLTTLNSQLIQYGSQTTSF
jgi:co-chaperonin GroES (HSP10)